MRLSINYLIGFVYIPLLILLLSFYFFGNLDFNLLYILYGLIIVVISILLFFQKNESIDALNNQILKHSTLIILGFFIVHFQFYLDLLVGFESISNFEMIVNPSIVIKSFLLSIIGLISFFLGYLVSCKIKRQSNNVKLVAYNTTFIQIFSLFLLGYYYYKVNPAYIMGGYNIVDMGTEAKYTSLAFTALIFSIIIQKSRNIIASGENVKKIIDFVKLCGYSTVFLVAIYLIGVLLSGDRGPLMTFPLIYIVGYMFVTKRKINWVLICLIIIVFSSVFSLLGKARSLGSDDGFIDKIQSAYVDNNSAAKTSIFPPTSELAMSVSALHHVVNMVPEYHDYLYGKLQIQELKLAVPFASKIFELDNSPESMKYWNIQNFTTWIVQGNNPTYGNGSTIISDLYVAFSIIGILYGMFLLGWFIRSFEVRMYGSYPPSLIWQIFIFVYFCDAIYLSRSSFLGSIKLIILIALVLFINRFIFSKKL